MGLFDILRKKLEQNKSGEIDQLLQQGNYDDALAVLDENFDDTSAENWYTKAKLLDKLEKQEQALGCYLQATNIDNSHYESWFRIGQIRFEAGDFKNASLAFAKTPILNHPINHTKWNSIATFYYMMSLYMQYLDSHDRQLRYKVTEQIQKLQTVINGDSSEEKFLTFCSNNLKDIIKNLEPKGEIDFTIPSKYPDFEK